MAFPGGHDQYTHNIQIEVCPTSHVTYNDITENAVHT